MRLDRSPVLLDLRETYNEVGEYSFKIVLDPNEYKPSHDAIIKILDPDRNEIECSVKKWGQKLCCCFSIDDRISNGVCLVEMMFVKKDGTKMREVTKFWVIK